jgi:TonB family protein
MSTLALQLDLRAASRRTRRTMGASVAVHALLLLALVLMHRQDPARDGGLVEVGWLDPQPAAAAGAPRPEVRSSVTVPGARTVVRSERKFEREVTTAAEVAPAVQDTRATVDLMNERLASLRTSNAGAQVAALANVSGAGYLQAAGEGIGSGTGMLRTGSGSSPSTLVRGGGEGRGAAPAALTRGVVPSRGPGVAAAVVAGTAKQALEPAAAPAVETAARRSLEGAQIGGAVADRPIVSYRMPEYPAWAARQAVEATVTLSFTVLPDGRVKAGIQVQKTAGFADFDLNAEAALRDWRFQPLPGGRMEEQWGTITFRYRLRDA